MDYIPTGGNFCAEFISIFLVQAFFGDVANRV